MSKLETLTDDELGMRLAEAFATDDTPTQNAIEAEANRRDSTPPASPLESALWYASQGCHVLPIRAGAKFPPLIKDWVNQASTDPGQIAQWWAANSRANIGLATGHRFDVVDIDGPLGQQSRREHWDTTFGHIDQIQIGTALTPRGMHIYVPATGEGNSVGILPGIDYRGRGGYVVAPPSTTSEGRYRWLGRATF